MQTPAELHLVQKLVSFLSSRATGSTEPRILNAGAGQSVSIEQQLTRAGCRYVCDRIDVEDCAVDFPSAGECWQCSTEDMAPLESGRYVAVFANYVMEHVEDIERASREVHRVLAPGGLFVATLPNTRAPEFLVAKHTPLWFHKLVRREHAWETKYAYQSVGELLEVFLWSGFRLEEESRWSFVEGYLGKYPIVGWLGRLYDRTISAWRRRAWMGDVCIALRKSE
jgi:SAM-dependent methyltransferase